MRFAKKYIYKTAGGPKRHKAKKHSKVTHFHLDLNILGHKF